MTLEAQRGANRAKYARLSLVQKEQRRARARENYQQHKKAIALRRQENGSNIKGNLRRFGLSLADYETLLAGQQGLCAICRREETSTYRGHPRRLAIDHCHQTLVLRGLLCMACNNGLGRFADSPARLRTAADYIERWKRQHTNAA